jgi:hypothetical protein
MEDFQEIRKRCISLAKQKLKESVGDDDLTS